MTCRTGEDFTGPWSAPTLMALEGGSIGFQLGGQSTDFVLLVMNDRGATSVLSSKVKLGADASAAAGPKGRTAAAATDVAMQAEMLSLLALARPLRRRVARRVDAASRQRRQHAGLRQRRWRRATSSRVRWRCRPPRSRWSTSSTRARRRTCREITRSRSGGVQLAQPRELPWRSCAVADDRRLQSSTESSLRTRRYEPSADGSKTWQ